MKKGLGLEGKLEGNLSTSPNCFRLIKKKILQAPLGYLLLVIGGNFSVTCQDSGKGTMRIEENLHAFSFHQA